MTNVIIKIQEARDLLNRENWRLKRLGVDGDLVLKLAFGYAMVSLSDRHAKLGFGPIPDILQVVTDKLNDRLPSGSRSVYGRNSPSVHYVVDIVGEISHILVDAVIHQLGHIAPNAKLIRLFGPDLLIQINEERPCPRITSPRARQSTKL